MDDKIGPKEATKQLHKNDLIKNYLKFQPLNLKG